MPMGYNVAFDIAGCPLAPGQTTTQDISALLGKTYISFDHTSGHNKGLPRVYKVCKNSSTIALEGRKLVRFSTTVTTHPFGCIVNGYVRIHTDDVAGMVDPDLGASGSVPVDSYFLLQTAGPALGQTPATDSVAGPVDFAVGAKVSAATAAASTQTTDAGCVATRNATLGATGTEVAAWIENAIGRCASVKATTNTSEAILIMLGD